jgi:DNA-binding CsgD family transcriptional regulator
MPQWESLYTNSWEQFTNLFVSTYGGADSSGELMRGVVDHEDFVRLARSARGYHLGDILSKVTAPTLVLAPRNPVNPALARSAREIASTIPNSQLVLYDGRNAEILSAQDGCLPPAVPVIEEFLENHSNRQEGVPDIRESIDTGLSKRELAVVRLLATGKSNQQIAEALVISPSTVAKHVTSILNKTSAANRTEVAWFAHRNGLV